MKHKVETHQCTGVILNENFILSTASCLKIEQDLSQVGVGLNNKQNDLIAIYDDGRIPIKNRIIHEHFNSTTLDNDIALVELAESIDFNVTRLRPICLLEQKSFWFNRMITFNWGNLKDFKNEIKTIDLNYLRYLKEQNLEDISYQIPDCFERSINSNRLCMRLIDKSNQQQIKNKTTNQFCKHDSGSPLILKEDDKLKIIGLFSHYTNFNRKNSINFKSIGVYTKISYYLQWIIGHIGDEICYS